MRQNAKDKLQQLVAPLLCLHDPQALAFKAFGHIRPRISLRFEECGLLLRDGRSVLSGVTGYFGHSKARRAATCLCTPLSAKAPSAFCWSSCQPRREDATLATASIFKVQGILVTGSLTAVGRGSYCDGHKFF